MVRVDASRKSLVGRVKALVTGAENRQELNYVSSVEVRAAQGIKGDRYFQAVPGREAKRDLTLIEVEAIDRLAREFEIKLEWKDTRRNIVTEGVRLEDLIGLRFNIGDVVCLGVEPCPPCAHLERLTQPGVVRGLARSGGIRAAVIYDGAISVDDGIYTWR